MRWRQSNYIGVLIFASIMGSDACRHRPTREVLKTKHSIDFDGMTRACSVEIRFDSSIPDPDDETLLQFNCDHWVRPFERELNNVLIHKIVAIHWIDQKGSVEIRFGAALDHGGLGHDSSLFFNFNTRSLKVSL